MYLTGSKFFDPGKYPETPHRCSAPINNPIPPASNPMHARSNSCGNSSPAPAFCTKPQLHWWRARGCLQWIPPANRLCPHRIPCLVWMTLRVICSSCEYHTRPKRYKSNYSGNKVYQTKSNTTLWDSRQSVPPTTPIWNPHLSSACEASALSPNANVSCVELGCRIWDVTRIW